MALCLDGPVSRWPCQREGSEPYFTVDQASLLALALSDALATFPEGSLWVDPALAPEGPWPTNARVAIVAVVDADADGHASPIHLEHAAEDGMVIWGVGDAGFAFSDRVLTGPRLHRLYAPRALLSFLEGLSADPPPGSPAPTHEPSLTSFIGSALKRGPIVSLNRAAAWTASTSLRAIPLRAAARGPVGRLSETAEPGVGFEVAPRPQWRVRRVLAGVSARDLQADCPFGLVAGPDLAPLRPL